jgi:hypothetical protein
MSLMLPKTLERKLERFKKLKGSTWSKELEGFLDDAVDTSVEHILKRASKLSVKEAEAILDKRRKPVLSDRQAGKVAHEAVIMVRQRRKSV